MRFLKCFVLKAVCSEAKYINSIVLCIVWRLNWVERQGFSANFEEPNWLQQNNLQFSNLFARIGILKGGEEVRVRCWLESNYCSFLLFLWKSWHVYGRSCRANAQNFYLSKVLFGIPIFNLEVYACLFVTEETLYIMAIRVVEFSNGGYKIRKIFA